MLTELVKQYEVLWETDAPMEQIVDFCRRHLQMAKINPVLVTLKPYKWHFVFLWFLLGALPPNPWSFSGIGTSGESLKEAVFSRHRPGFRPFVHPAIP